MKPKHKEKKGNKILFKKRKKKMLNLEKLKEVRVCIEPPWLCL